MSRRARPKGLRLPISPIDLSALPTSERLGGSDPEASNYTASSVGQEVEQPRMVDIPQALKLNVELQDVQVIQELGAGNGGTVHKVLHKTTGTVMALKVIPVEAKASIQKQILRELQILHDCSSPFIVGYYGAFLNAGDISICMEYMHCGALDSILKKVGPFPEVIVGKVTHAVLGGLVYLFEKHRIIHRDVKPSNILINNHGQIKIADFGVSGQLLTSLANTFVGTSAYMSPERIQGLKYSVQCDIWSLGLTLVELVTGSFPMPRDSKSFSVFELLQFVVNERIPTPPPGMFSPEFDSFVSRCLIKTHDTRPTPKELLSDPFVLRAEAQNLNLEPWARTLV